MTEPHKEHLISDGKESEKNHTEANASETLRMNECRGGEHENASWEFQLPPRLGGKRSKQIVKQKPTLLHLLHSKPPQVTPPPQIEIKNSKKASPETKPK